MAARVLHAWCVRCICRACVRACVCEGAHQRVCTLACLLESSGGDVGGGDGNAALVNDVARLAQHCPLVFADLPHIGIAEAA